MKMKNRGLAQHISGSIGQWQLPPTFNAGHVLPYVKETFPGAKRADVGYSLAYVVQAKKPGLTSLGAGLFRKADGLGDLEALASDAIIDDALDALAKVEAALRAQKTLRAKMAEMRKLLNGG